MSERMNSVVSIRFDVGNCSVELLLTYRTPATTHPVPFGDALEAKRVKAGADHGWSPVTSQADRALLLCHLDPILLKFLFLHPDLRGCLGGCSWRGLFG